MCKLFWPTPNPFYPISCFPFPLVFAFSSFSVSSPLPLFFFVRIIPFRCFLFLLTGRARRDFSLIRSKLYFACCVTVACAEKNERTQVSLFVWFSIARWRILRYDLSEFFENSTLNHETFNRYPV